MRKTLVYSQEEHCKCWRWLGEGWFQEKLNYHEYARTCVASCRIGHGRVFHIQGKSGVSLQCEFFDGFGDNSQLGMTYHRSHLI